MRPFVILALAWSLFVLLAYPGTMTEEAFEHAGALHVVWHALDTVIVAPFSVVALQSAVWLVGANLLARRFGPPGAEPLVASAALLCAPMLGGLAVVSSHTLAVALAMLGTGLALHRPRWLAAPPFALAAWLVVTAGNSTLVTDRARLIAAGIPWGKTPVQRALAHVIVAPRGVWLWLASAASLAAAIAIARRLSRRPLFRRSD